MADDPYKTLGVKKDASQEDIQKAYRRRAKKLHPDLNPGDRQAEEQFKEVSAAYDLLSDPEKRTRFDRGEIDASGAERPERRYYRDFGEGRADNPYATNAGFADFSDVGDADDIMSAFFGRSAQRNRSRRGSDVRYSLDVDFLDAANGATRTITLPDGSTLDVKIPPGTRDGQVLRLRGKGQPGFGDGPPGDALIEVHVQPHPLFPARGRRHSHRAASIAARRCPGREAASADAHGDRDDDDSQVEQYRSQAPLEGQGHPSSRRQPRRRICHVEDRTS